MKTTMTMTTTIWKARSAMLALTSYLGSLESIWIDVQQSGGKWLSHLFAYHSEAISESEFHYRAFLKNANLKSPSSAFWSAKYIVVIRATWALLFLCCLSKSYILQISEADEGAFTVYTIIPFQILKVIH